MNKIGRCFVHELPKFMNGENSVVSTNVSKEKREKLIQKITAIKQYLQSAPQDENTAQLLTYIADIEKDVKGKKYGLVFEEHRESIDEVLENNLPVLTENKGLFIDNGGQVNFLIEGDNLASLKLLEKTHKGKIDLIYIDPPYNTGNKDFVYDDSFVDSNDTFRHSKWLSFMEKRLQIARNLLSEKGVIFISIDDNEQSALKMLCDNVFGEQNLITVFHWEKTQHFGRQKINSYSNCEYVLTYAKRLIDGKIKELLVEKINSELTDAPLYNASNNVKVLTFPIGSVKFNIADGEYCKTTSDDYILLSPVIVKNHTNINELVLQFKSRWAQSTVDEEYLKGTTFWVKSEKFAIRTIYHQGKSSTVAPKSIIFTNNNNPFVAINRFGEKVGVNENASAELNDIVANDIFSYPKPTSLITYLLSLYYDEIDSCFTDNLIILDFFAGSGTTGHAVMKLNAEGGGSRKFILCTNNENNICRDVTYERIKRVIAKEDYKASLKYFKVDYLPISDKLYYEYADELLLHICELVELENGINFNGNNEIAIILTEAELDDFVANIPETCKAIYVGHDVLPTEEQEKIFAKNKIKVNVIPEYYYRDLEG